MNDLANQRQPAGPWSSASQGAVSVREARDSGTYSSCPEAGAQFPKKLGNQGGVGGILVPSAGGTLSAFVMEALSSWPRLLCLLSVVHLRSC